MIINIDNNNRKRYYKPFIRWAGGKQNIIKDLVECLPKDFKERRYFEPFLGAGSMFFAIQPAQAYLSDINVHLINSFNAVRNSPETLHKYLLIYKRNTSEKHYYHIRDEFNSNIHKNSIKQAARFIYLIQTCFNGIYRVNKLGYYNVPYGNKKNIHLPSLSELVKRGRLLKSAHIFTCSYEEILTKIKKNDLIYIDPPYPPLNGTSCFAHYYKNKFDKTDHEKLSIFTHQLDQLGCKVMISYANSDIIMGYYKHWNRTFIEVRRYITCKKQRHKVNEIIFTNY
jgi:DNA adenine methylase